MHPTTTLPSRLPKARKLRLAAAYYAAYTLLGLMLTSIGPCLDALQEQSNSSKGGVSLLFAANSLGYLAGSLLGGPLYGRLAGSPVMATAFIGMALATATLPLLGSLWLLMVMFALIGLALGLADCGGNTLMIWLYRHEVPPYMTALHLSFGVGAFIGPLIIDRFAVATGDAVTSYWLFAALMVPVALWLARNPTPDGPGDAQAAVGGLSALRRHAWLIGLISLFFFMHMGAELAFGGWIYSYAEEAIGSETTARVLNSLFWGGLVVGRLIAIPLAVRLSPRAVLQLDLLGSVASLTLIVALPDWPAALWIGTIGFGISVASMIPGSFNFAAQHIPITSQVTAGLLAGGTLGSMALPWLVGQLFEPYGRQWAMYVTGAAILVAALLLGGMQAAGRRRSSHLPTGAPGEAPAGQ